VPPARDALLIIAAAHSLDIEVTLRGRWLAEVYVPTGRSLVRGPVARLAPGTHLGDGTAPDEYEVRADGKTWTFFPNDVVDLKVVWMSPTERDRLPPEDGRISLRCPSCACIATYPVGEAVVHCVSCRQALRVPERPTS
jgi:hypothetical protein